jgi:mannan endo-1,4-beta-mannosidase
MVPLPVLCLHLLHTYLNKGGFFMMLQKKAKVSIALGLVLCLLVSSFYWLPAAYAGSQAVNSNVSPEAKALLNYLYDISGKGIISGQFNYIEDPAYWTDKAVEITGEQPGLWGGDFSFYFGIDLAEARQKLVDTAIEQWKNGSVVALCWHQQKPNDPADAGWGSVQGWYTEQEMTELVTPGTDLYNQWITAVDEIAGYIKQLRDAGVPVLWRPYHEMNGGWFWWGGRAAQFKQLWKNMYDRYVNYHGLDNLIWVWGPNANNDWADPLADYHPGDEYVDICAVDIYDGFKDAYYSELLEVANGKPVAIGECGELPDIELIQSQQPQYAYYMGWGKMLTENNSPTEIQAAFGHPYTLNRDEIDISMLENLVENSEFDSGTDNWELQQSGGATGSMNAVTGEGLSGVNALKATPVDSGTGQESVQVNQIFPVQSAKTYTISFMAKADAAKDIKVKLVKNKSSNIAYWEQTISVTTSAEIFGPYTFESNNIVDPMAVLQFDLGGDAIPVYIDAVTVTDGTPVIPIPAPTPVPTHTWVTVDDRDPAVKYNGKWICDTLQRDYKGSETYTNTADNYVQFTFSGTSVQYIGSMQEHLGMVDIYIDGEKVATLDLYKPGNGLPHTLLYEKTGLERGMHTIKLVATGSRNAAASDCYVVLDAFRYYYEPAPIPTPVPTPTPSPTPDPANKLTGTTFGTSPAWGGADNTYDKAFDGNTGTFFDYLEENGGYTGIDLGEGNEKRITRIRFYPRTYFTGRMTGGKFQGSNNSMDSGYTDLYTIAAEPSSDWNDVTVNDTTAYRYVRYLSPDGGLCNVAEIEFYDETTASPTPLPEYANLVKNSELDNGTESWYWMQSGDADGRMSVMSDAGLSGTNALKVSFANSGSDPWNAQVNQDFPIQSGKTYTISFMARADAPRSMSLILQQSAAPYSAYWYKEVNLATTAETFGPYTFTCNDTDPAAVFRFNLGGDANGVYIDKVVITDGTIAVPVTVPDNTWDTVDDRNSRIVFKGTWTKDVWNGDYDGTETYINMAAAAAEFSFVGTRIQYIAYKQDNLGYVDIYIDGVKDTSLDLYNPGGTGPLQTVLYEKSVMNSGIHTIKLVVTGNKNEAAADCYVVLDAFKYINEVSAAPETGTTTMSN